MTPETMTGLFFGMAFILLIAISLYVVFVLPEVSEYNEHLKEIKYQLEQGNCSAGYVTVYPDYYIPEPVEDCHDIKYKCVGGACGIEVDGTSYIGSEWNICFGGD